MRGWLLLENNTCQIILGAAVYRYTQIYTVYIWIHLNLKLLLQQKFLDASCWEDSRRLNHHSRRVSKKPVSRDFCELHWPVEKTLQGNLKGNLKGENFQIASSKLPANCFNTNLWIAPYSCPNSLIQPLDHIIPKSFKRFKGWPTWLCGGFLKWWVSPTKPMGFPTKNGSFWGVKWGYHPCDSATMVPYTPKKQLWISKMLRRSRKQFAAGTHLGRFAWKKTPQPERCDWRFNHLTGSWQPLGKTLLKVKLFVGYR